MCAREAKFQGFQGTVRLECGARILCLCVDAVADADVDIHYPAHHHLPPHLHFHSSLSSGYSLMCT